MPANGGVLNDFLLQSHNNDGTLKDNSVGSSEINNGAVTPAKIRGIGAANGIAPLDADGDVISATGDKMLSKSVANTIFVQEIIVRERTSSEADDTAAINEALNKAATLNTNGSVTVRVQQGRSPLISAGGHTRPEKTRIDFGGNTVIHTGNNVFLDCHTTGGLDWQYRIGVSNLHLIGNSGTQAVGIELGNTAGFQLENVDVDEYANGIGIDFHNRVNWCEITTSRNIGLHENAIAIRFVGSDGGTDSFAYTILRELAINVPAGGIGIQFNPPSNSLTGGLFFYNSTIQGGIWLGDATSTGIQVNNYTNVTTSLWEVTGEGSDAATAIDCAGGGIRAFGFIRLPGSINATPGQLEITAPTGYSLRGIDSTGASLHEVLQLMEGSAATPKIGFGTGSNCEFTWTTGYDFGGNDIFRAYAVGYENNDPATWSIPFRVGGQGDVTATGDLSAANSNVSGISKAGTFRATASEGIDGSGYEYIRAIDRADGDVTAHIGFISAPNIEQTYIVGYKYGASSPIFDMYGLSWGESVSASAPVMSVDVSGDISNDGALLPGSTSNDTSKSSITMGVGIPTSQAASGSIYFRTDTPTAANQRIYINTSSGSGTTWAAIA